MRGEKFNGFKRFQAIKKREKSHNCNKDTGRNRTNTIAGYKWGSGYDKFGLSQYVYDEYGIKFASKQCGEFMSGITTKDTANIPESDLHILLHNGIIDDYWKVSPMDWEHHHDRTKWKKNKNKCKIRRREIYRNIDAH